tara:strand:- start:348 stop:551 length:204 start_codon:yes stop_codon:yes gene_type:complete
MKKIFQWQDINWKTMTPQERLNFKRLCLMPLFVYGIYIFLNRYALTFLIMLGIYFAYKWFEKRNNRL